MIPPSDQRGRDVGPMMAMLDFPSFLPFIPFFFDVLIGMWSFEFYSLGGCSRGEDGMMIRLALVCVSGFLLILIPIHVVLVFLFLCPAPSRITYSSLTSWIFRQGEALISLPSSLPFLPS